MASAYNPTGSVIIEMPAVRMTPCLRTVRTKSRKKCAGIALNILCAKLSLKFSLLNKNFIYIR